MEKGKSDFVASELVTSKLQTVDLFLRFLVFAASLVGLLVMGNSSQTALTETTEIGYFPALIYYEVALSIAGFYAIITVIASFVASGKPTPSKKLLILFAVLDAMMVGIVASATGSAAAFGYVDLKGNPEMGWMYMCHSFPLFCRYIAVASAVSLFESIVLVLLVLSSTYHLYHLSK
ncbi:CASP-like protein 1D2 [Macadamia integrifolia]|uniref:CASP-like protein 1D2 n=1 Tax=Macadamia integrifolia TaxID=60698 RepID=UPI001C52972F|nr:CASP-like protein 1D2 [Macadamia integrifolia]